MHPGANAMRGRRARASRLAPAILLALGASCSGAPAGDPVAREFEAICRSLRESDDVYQGQRRLKRLEGWLASAASREPRHSDPARSEAHRLALASELLEQGRTDEALRHLTGSAADGAGSDPDPAAQPNESAPAATPGLSAAATLLGSGRGDATDPSLRIRRLALARNAHLQAGEDLNCRLRHTAVSCILPFAPDAIHVEPEHARRAGDLSLEILELRPDSVSARWLLGITRMVSGDYPDGVPDRLRLPEGVFLPESSFPRWSDRAPQLGVAAVDLAGGAVMDDFDGDGLLDLVSSTADPCDHLKAWRNDGRGGFEDVSAAWGLDTQLGGLNLTHADFDGDGRLDLLVLRGGWQGRHGEVRNSLLRNEPEGAELRFVDVTRAAGLDAGAYPTQTAAWADYDADGDLDVYVGNESWVDLPYPSQLFRNDGDGTFRDVALAAGVVNMRFAKGTAWGDVDDDGDVDLYVSNIGPNRLYRNEGDGTFTDVAAELGVAEPSGRSFATWFFDYDNDGRLDLFVADYGATADDVMAGYLGLPVQGGHPLLYHNEGGTFTEVSGELGMRRPTLPMGANHGDLDADGWLDVYLGTGNPRFEALVPNVMLRNRAGRRFEEVSFAGGFAHLQKGHGVAWGDLDNDGDEDLFHQLGGFFPGDAYANALFENPGAAASWVTLRLEGASANRFGVGARIAVRVRGPDGKRTLHRVADAGGSFGGSSLQQEIGLGSAEAIEEIRIRWPGGGGEDRHADVEPNRVYRALEGAARLVPVEVPRLSLAGAPAGHGHR